MANTSASWTRPAVARESIAADPISSRVINAIDFTLQSGEQIDNAFTYDWRLWSPRELIDAMLDAGFASVEAHDTLGAALVLLLVGCVLTIIAILETAGNKRRSQDGTQKSE